jgi:hypothetical protein
MTPLGVIPSEVEESHIYPPNLFGGCLALTGLLRRASHGEHGDDTDFGLHFIAVCSIIF